MHLVIIRPCQVSCHTAVIRNVLGQHSVGCFFNNINCLLKTVVIAKNTAGVDEIFVDVPTSGVAIVRLNPPDTAGLVVDREYTYECEVYTPGDTVVYTVCKGKFIVKC